MKRLGIQYLVLGIAVVVVVTQGFVYLERENGGGQRAVQCTAPACGVASLGKLVPAGEVIRVSAGSEAGCAVRRLFVQEGQRVKRGQVIAELDRASVRGSQVAVAKRHVALCEARLRQVQAPGKAADIASQDALIARLRNELAQCKLDAERFEYLFKEGAVSANESEQYGTRYRSKKCELDAAIANRESLVQVRDVDVQVAEEELQQAKSELERAVAEARNELIVAPTDGVVVAVNTHAGEREANAGIVELANNNKMFARADVYESDVAGLRIGQRAEITGDAIRVVIRGKITRIGNAIVAQSINATDPSVELDRRVVQVWVAIDPKDLPRCRNLINAIVEVKFQ